MLDICRKLNLSPTTTKYAVVWGLLHDIGTWPLSHTSEIAFSSILNIGSRELRNKIIMGDSSIPNSFRLNRKLIDIGIDLKTLLSLFITPAIE